MKKLIIAAIAALMALAFTGCSNVKADEIEARNGHRSEYAMILPAATGEVVYETENVILDASNKSDGYVMVKYTGNNQKVKVIVKSSDSKESYLVHDYDEFVVLPLTCGNGTYLVSVCENIEGTEYRVAFEQELVVELNNEFAPFLVSSYYVEFTEAAMGKTAELAANCSSDKEIVENVYEYIINNISYDEEKAETVESGYVPNADETFASHKGICLDYASLMAVMLRSQGIPTQLHFGYSDDVYHAWVEYFNGNDWVLVDPTLGASNNNADVEKYVGDGSNYSTSHIY